MNAYRLPVRPLAIPTIPKLIKSGGSLAALILLMVGSTGRAATEPCHDGDQSRIWLAPRQPVPGKPVNVMAVSTQGALDELLIYQEDEPAQRLDTLPRGGPPWSLSGSFTPDASSRYRIEVRREGRNEACQTLSPDTAPPHWRAREWDRPTEAFYSAWIEKLFDAPTDENLSFRSLEPVLQDPDRNFLHGFLGLREDDRLPARPDCADLPYFLRAYFAWKMGLPLSYRACDRGRSQVAPHCGPPMFDDRFSQGPASPVSFSQLTRKIADIVHSGSARTALDDEATDFYPVPISRESLWPGTIFADPYGHILVVARWIPQSDRRPGLLLAADAQPDNTVARKRFWEGNFLFAQTRDAGPGFKAFRAPLRKNGQLGLPDNLWLAVRATSAAFSNEQDDLTADEFYAEMGKLINPDGVTPEQAYDMLLEGLVEQLETRINAVNNGEAFQRRQRKVMSMPRGTAIFTTTGPWEDYATPSRDMRLLIAMKVLEQLPEKIVRHPDLFRLGGRSAESARADIESRHERLAREKRFSYLRSDGTPWTLTIADLLARKTALEVAYNPNDCVEIRWGAEPGSAEFEPCRRHAPTDQRDRMQQYRDWFRRTERPVR